MGCPLLVCLIFISCPRAIEVLDDSLNMFEGFDACIFRFRYWTCMCQEATGLVCLQRLAATSVDPNWKRVFRSVRLDAWKGKKGNGPRYPPLYWLVNRNPPTNHQPTGVLNTAHLSIENLGFQGYPEVFGTDWPVPSISKIFVHNFGKGGAWKRMESIWKPTKNCHFCNRKP